MTGEAITAKVPRGIAKRDSAFDLAEYVITTKYEDLAPEVVEVTKRSILDTLGVIAAASSLGQGCKEIVELVKGGGAKGESTIIGYGGRVPSWMAGFANGSMTHQLDYDDVHDEAMVHPSACTVPAAFATAEEVGGVSGKEFITAVAVAIDLACRMGLTITQSNWGHGSDWFLSPLFGFYAATAAAGKILGLSEEEMLSAFGHTLQQAAGSLQVAYSSGSVFRGIRDGFSVKAGILSALMAKKGLPGTKDSLESKAGLYNLYFGGVYERFYLIDCLGKRFEGTGVSFKPWPSCRLTHAPIEATLGILQERGIVCEDVEQIRVSVAEAGRRVVEPLQARRRPQTITDARFSIPFTLGIAAARGKVVIKDFTVERLKDPLALQTAQKVTGKIAPQLKDNTYSAIVEIRTKDGKRYVKRIDFPYGHPNKPLSVNDLKAKFRDCVSYSAMQLSQDEVERVIRMVGKLEELDDVSTIIRMFG